VGPVWPEPFRRPTRYRAIRLRCLVRVGVVVFLPVRVAVLVFVFVAGVRVGVGVRVFVIVIVIGMTVIVNVLGAVGVVVSVRMLFFHNAPRSCSL
jgi:hypothetical protein